MIYIIIKILTSNSYAIGYIESIKGTITSIIDDQKIILDELDEIKLNQKIILDKNSEIVILLDDGSTIMIKDETIFQITEYEDIFSINPHYAINLENGDFQIETGELPKFKKNSSFLNTPAGKLYLNGTAVAAKFNGLNSEIYLLTDSFGGEGELILEDQDGQAINIELNSGLTIGENGPTKIELTNEIKESQNNIKNVIASSALSDEKKIEQIVQKKISQGKISPQEADAIKEQIIRKKEKKIDQIVTSSKSNTAVLGELLKNSDGFNGSKILEKVIDQNPKLTSKVLDTVIDQNQNLFKEISSNNSALTEKLIKTVVKEADENDNSISKIIAKTDSNVSANLMNELLVTKKELMVKVVSETSTLNPDKFKEISEFDDAISEKITNSIVEKLMESPDATDDLKAIIINADPDLTNSIISQTIKIDSSVVDDAASAALLEDGDSLTKKLSQSIDSENSTIFNEIIVSKALETGNNQIISNAAELNIQKKITNNPEETKPSTDKINTASIPQGQKTTVSINNQKIKLDAQESLSKINLLVNKETEKLIIKNPDIEIKKNILTNAQEILASPN